MDGKMNNRDTSKKALLDELRACREQIEAQQKIIAVKERQHQEILSREEKYKTILENMEEFYFEVDLVGRFTFFNDQLCEICGYPREVLMGMSNKTYTKNNIALKMYKDFNEVFRTGHPLRFADYEIVTKEGQSKYIEVSVSLRKGKDGQSMGFCGIGRDITDRKQKEMERALLIDQLQQAQRLEAIATLAGGVAHDFNNILMGMQGNISLILLKVDAGTTTFERLKKVEALIERGADLIQQLLGYAKINTYHVDPVNINLVIDHTSHFFGRIKKDILVTKNLQKNIWTVDINKSAVEQVLLSLYMNAEQAMPNGGELVIQTKNTFIDKTSARSHNLKHGRYVHICVKDTGIGMDAATQKKIFDPFFTTKALGQGNGLGLASVFGIVRNHGGMIDVESEKHHGTAFNIFLPASSDRNEIKNTSGDDSPLADSETVLLVNDDELMNDVCESFLRELGYRVILAKSICEACDKCAWQINKIKMVMVDLNLPDMKCLTDLDPLKAHTDIPVLLMDGGGFWEDISENHHVHVIQKPFSLSQLSEKVKALLK